MPANTHDYDVVVVGARCAGSPTAMLLARRGYRVLAVDRARFPSDTVSTHLVHPPGIAALDRWGLLDRLTDSGCPPIDTYLFDLGPFVLSGRPGTAEHPVAYAPRRTVLDHLLVEAAAEAGVEVREGFTVSELVVEDGAVVGIRGHGTDGRPVTERARVVIGADGRHSLVARAVAAEQYLEKPPILAGYYSYWSGLPMDGRFETYLRPDRGFAAWPTHDDLTLVVGGWPHSEFEANKRDIEGNFLAMLELAPDFAQRLQAGRREARFAGASVQNYLRVPAGPGWALVGDAGYNKDFITAQGISDAFRDADLCASAVHEVLDGGDQGQAMTTYRETRDRHVLPMYELTCEFATLDPPPEMLGLLAAMAGNQEAIDGFVQVNSGVVSPADFFSDENVGRILGAATRRAG